jgi:phage gpG-like protein
VSAKGKIDLSFDRRGFERMHAQIRGMQERAADLTPAWETLIEHFAERNFRQFLSRGREYGTPWKPLRPRTIRDKLRHGYPTDPLIRTAKLVHSLTIRPLGIERIGPREMSAGTSVAWAKYHQYGAPRAGLPARPLFDLDDISNSKVATYVIANWILDGVRSTRPRKRR